MIKHKWVRVTISVVIGLITFGLIGLYTLLRVLEGDYMFRYQMNISIFGPLLAVMCYGVCIYLLFFAQGRSIVAAISAGLLAILISYVSLWEIKLNTIVYEINSQLVFYRSKTIELVEVKDEGEPMPYCYAIKPFHIELQSLNSYPRKLVWKEFRGVWPINIPRREIHDTFRGFDACTS